MSDTKVYKMLSAKMQKKIAAMRWQQFTDIQRQAIPFILEETNDLILSANTAAGKTEAVFLPLISMFEKQATEQLKIVYISPLKSLINNQFQRIEQLCKALNIPVTKWHGDAEYGLKKKFLQEPEGILQITPESIEAMFVNRPHEIYHLFHTVEAIVIDEIHAFYGTERGVQLRSLIARIEETVGHRIRIIGLSATIDATTEGQQQLTNWLRPDTPEHVTILQEKKQHKNQLLNLQALENAEDLYMDIFQLTRQSKALIFRNARTDVELTTHELNKLSEFYLRYEKYLAYHSSIDKSRRLFIEEAMQNPQTKSCIVTTSALELGIDIGDIDMILQINPTYSVSSLKQRIGRSGRRGDTPQILQMYATDDTALLQSTALMQLLLDNQIEPAESYEIPYDILVQQILSICHERNGCTMQELLASICQNASFMHLPQNDIKQVIEHLTDAGYLQQLRGNNEYIVGKKGEQLIKTQDFYAVFLSIPEYDVMAGDEKIGSISKSLFVRVGTNMIFSGRMWTMKHIDHAENKCYVEPAKNGQPAKFEGDAAAVSNLVAEKIYDVLTSNQVFDFVDETVNEHLDELRKPYRSVRAAKAERLLWKQGQQYRFDTFTGTKRARTIAKMLEKKGAKIGEVSPHGRISFTSKKSGRQLIQEISEETWNPLTFDESKQQDLIETKYSKYLPESLHRKFHNAHFYDIKGAQKFLQNTPIRIVGSNEE